jgi:hypothetical protein
VVQFLLSAADPRPGLSYLVLGPAGGFLGALLSHLSPGGRVASWEPEKGVARAMVRSLESAGLSDRVEVLTSAPPEGAWDRVVVAKPIPSPPPAELKHLLADLGILLYPTGTEAGYALARVMRDGDEFVEMVVGDVESQEHRRPISRLLGTEVLMARVWQDDYPTPLDQHFRESVETTFSPDFLEVKQGWQKRWLAQKAFHLGYIHQALGDLEEAEDLYRRSLDLFPSAEAHTFLGWTYSFQARLDDAIEECRRAIAVDPTLGNPYNDIGAYYLEKGMPAEAIPWLEKATSAERYCCYFYAHSNLGRAYMLLGLRDKAKEAFEKALEIQPDYPVAKHFLQQLEGGAGHLGDIGV